MAQLHGAKDSLPFPVTPRIKKLIRHSNKPSIGFTSEKDRERKVLVRNDVVYCSRHPREVAIEKSTRMKDVTRLGFLSDTYTSYKSLGDPILDAENLVVATLFPTPNEKGEASMASLHTSSAAGSYHNTEGNARSNSPGNRGSAATRLPKISKAMSPRSLNGSAGSGLSLSHTQRQSAINTRAGMQEMSLDPSFYSRYRNGYNLIQEKLLEGNNRTRYVKLGFPFIETFRNQSGDLSEDELADGKRDPEDLLLHPINYWHWMFDKEKKEYFEKLIGKKNVKFSEEHLVEKGESISAVDDVKGKEENSEAKNAFIAEMANLLPLFKQLKGTMLENIGNKYSKRINQTKDSFYSQRARMNVNLRRQLASFETERVGMFKRKIASFSINKNHDWEMDLLMMRERARQIKVQEKLNQMTDITWYEELLAMLPVSSNNLGSLSHVRSIVPEERLLKKIKSYIETDTSFNKQTFVNLLRGFSKDEFQQELMQRVFRFLKSYAFKLTERDYLAILEELGYEEVRFNVIQTGVGVPGMTTGNKNLTDAFALRTEDESNSNEELQNSDEQLAEDE